VKPVEAAGSNWGATSIVFKRCIGYEPETRGKTETHAKEKAHMNIKDLRPKGFAAGALAAGVLALLLGTSALSKAQEGRDEVKPTQQEEPKKEEARPQQKEQPRDMKPQHEKEPARAEEGKTVNEKQEHAQETRSGHETHPVAHSQRIPDEKFHSQFGRQHTFHVQKTVVVEGQPRFNYGGYWFALSTPWPQGWAYTDDVYLDYIDGEYVLIDLLHPGMQLTIVVVG